MVGRLRSLRVRMGIVLAVSVMWGIGTGCGDGDFVTPPPDRREVDGPPVQGQRAATKAADLGSFTAGGTGTIRRIDFIESGRIDPDIAQVEEAGARTQAGYEKARIHISPTDDAAGSPGSSADPVKSQADRIRASIAGKPPQAIIVDPDDPADKELARAIVEARAAKIPVVVVGRPVAGAGEAKPGAAPMILVAPHPFEESARRLVELSIRNLKAAGVDPARGALILFTETGDRLIPERAAAIRKALADAKIAAVQEVRVPRDLTAGGKALKQRLVDDPKPVMVFFFDFYGASMCRDVAGELGEGRPFVTAGYTADEGRTRMVRAGDYAAVAEYEPVRLIRKAVTVAAAAAQGRESKDREEIAINMLESPAGSGLPRVTPKEAVSIKKPAEERGQKGD